MVEQWCASIEIEGENSPWTATAPMVDLQRLGENEVPLKVILHRCTGAHSPFQRWSVRIGVVQLRLCICDNDAMAVAGLNIELRPKRAQSVALLL